MAWITDSAASRIVASPSNCHELAVLRAFRDTYVSNLPGGLGLIREYYETAPLIVERINASTNRADLLSTMLGEIRNIVAAVPVTPELALTRYHLMFAGLKKSLMV